MPDISKINAVAVADIEKLDSILAANIEKVNGLTFATAVPISTPTAAYSVRLLDSAVGVPTYTGAAMRVRRETAGGAGDDDEADIAFDTSLTAPTISLDSAISNASAGVTATTLGQFLNVGTVNGTTYTNPDSLTVTASCFVDEWKDQSGNANHAEQATHAIQPQIHDGTVDTDLIQENGKPAIYFNGSQTLSHSSNIASTSHTIHCVIERQNAVRVFYGVSSGWFAAFSGDQVRTSTNSIQQVTKSTGQVTYIHTYDGSNVATWYEDNSSLGSSNIGIRTMSTNSIGGFASYKHRSNYQELILWPIEQPSTNVSGIATDAMTYYSIT